MPCIAIAAAQGQGVLRLHESRASREIHYAQEDRLYLVTCGFARRVLTQEKPKQDPGGLAQPLSFWETRKPLEKVGTPNKSRKFIRNATLTIRRIRSREHI
jgi:hypothetical protein